MIYPTVVISSATYHLAHINTESYRISHITTIDCLLSSFISVVDEHITYSSLYTLAVKPSSSAALRSQCGSSSPLVLHSWPFRGLPLSVDHPESSRSYPVAILRYSLPSGRVPGLKPLALVFRLEMYATMRILYHKIMNCPGRAY